MPKPKPIRTNIAWSEVDRIEEMKEPMAYQVKTWAQREATAHLRGA